MNTNIVFFILVIYICTVYGELQYYGNDISGENDKRILAISAIDTAILDCPPVPTYPTIHEDPQIYWKDFTGPPVPKDAISSGVQTTPGGKPRKIFLGQASFSVPGSGLQPTAIFNDSSSVYNSYRRTISTDKNIKVLCSNMPPDSSDEFLKWVSSDVAKTHSESHLVTAGYETQGSLEYPVYFGRTYDGFLFVTGKAVKQYNQKGFFLYYPWQSGERRIDENVEVLVYSKYF